jgi:TatD DNase family protein
VLKEGLTKLDTWTEAIKNSKIKPVAIGEIGLDYHWAKNNEDIAKERVAFEKMVDLAEDMRLPVVIHSRKAETDCITYLKERKFSNGIMMHFFAGDEKEALRAIDLGAYVSIPPIHSKERRKVISIIGLENMLVETDAPYVGRTPEDVKRAAEYISEVKNVQLSEVADATTKNAVKLFKLNL